MRVPPKCTAAVPLFQLCGQPLRDDASAHSFTLECRSPDSLQNPLETMCSTVCSTGCQLSAKANTCFQRRPTRFGCDQPSRGMSMCTAVLAKCTANTPLSVRGLFMFSGSFSIYQLVCIRVIFRIFREGSRAFVREFVSVGTPY